MEIWLGIANGQISSIFDRIIWPPHDSGGVLSIYVFSSPVRKYRKSSCTTPASALASTLVSALAAAAAASPFTKIFKFYVRVLRPYIAGFSLYLV